ncbi:flagellar basal body-associated protein FliL [Treponema primitia ZAS-2]|uniref:Flagellar basal body-associated protein FliL n=1 Tax=Treponema primitia (strain ATCC BAA-887 / DSM 12427 / ZAS-2) TaxID=545694 RepID=F5YH86_TREPZ|nr:flagellar basal body-associated FliL family protein [Treponema primitia]AEF84879.1 flagellar basal body-associated protein FliL [Treponema primitia ZAS-2]
MSRREYRPTRAKPAAKKVPGTYTSSSRSKSPRAALGVYRTLMALVLLLILVILGGTLYALVLRPKPAASGSSHSGASSAPANGLAGSSEASMFTALGRLRCPAAGGAVILQAVFPYYPGDRPFSEELVSRIREFRNLTLDYFAALSAEELYRIPESAVKAELLSRYNALLRLGQIETLYFNEFLIIE